MRFNPYTILLLLCGAPLALFATEGERRSDVSTDLQIEKTEDSRIQWWRDAKFGMFIHWGVYAVPAGTWEPAQLTGGGEWIMYGGKIPVEDYRPLAQEFNPVHYDPDAWARLAKAAGMKYMVITAKHHDGFALYDSKVTAWDIADASPYGQDLLAPLVESAHAKDLKIGFYYSQAQDWMHPGGAKMRFEEGDGWDERHRGDFDQYLRTIAVPQMEELLGNYDIDILWWDTPVWMNEARAQLFQPLLKEHPDLIQNDRLGGESHGDVETPENYIPARGIPDRDWETCMTMNGSWGYDTHANDWKSTGYLIRALVDVVSKGGNLLLNVGPKPDGTIPRESIDTLHEMGTWMEANDVAIHGTSASPVGRPGWGRITTKPLDQGTRLYLHVFYWPVNGQLTVPVLNRVIKCSRLTDPERTFKTRRTKEGLVISLDGEVPDPNNTVLVLDIHGSPQAADLRLEQAEDGSLQAQAMDAFIINGNFGKQTYYQHEHGGGFIEQWRSPRVRLEWDIHIDQPGVFELKVDAAGPVEGSEINFEVNGQASKNGQLKIAAPGQYRLTANPVKEGWHPIRLQAVRLLPVTK